MGKAMWPVFGGVPRDPNEPFIGTDFGMPSLWYEVCGGRRQDVDANGRGVFAPAPDTKERK